MHNDCSKLGQQWSLLRRLKLLIVASFLLLTLRMKPVLSYFMIYSLRL